jgi:hypothetical protein
MPEQGQAAMGLAEQKITIEYYPLFLLSST